MSEAFLGPLPFDIHGGGLDLIFPHHENEIAQSCCAHGLDTMARYWMHNGFLDMRGEKMSKSLGNVVRVPEALATVPGEAVRLLLLSTQYRQPADFSRRGAARGQADARPVLRCPRAGTCRYGASPSRPWSRRSPTTSTRQRPWPCCTTFWAR